MKLLLKISIIIFFSLTTTHAYALTIKNKCNYSVAGSVKIAENKISVAQFNIAPGQSQRILDNFEKVPIIISTIPNVYDMKKLKITSIEIDNPDRYIELKQSPEGIKFKMK
ncbi:hypothetical protein [Maridesulfovibrio sp.]|uniref:hypothetical protein n=1 Tax=Maridesulfovibrio sp. TaxID=2795000 RepID=UPI0029F5509D|nr:hypothetical protein [Maridesulfovibrio sp.]